MARRTGGAVQERAIPKTEPGTQARRVAAKDKPAGPAVLLEPLPPILPALHAEPKPMSRAGRPPQPAPGPTDDEIRLRAYQIYVERGCVPGHDVDDWVQAERELIARRAA